MRKKIRVMWAALCVIVIAVVVSVLGAIYSGFYDVTATSQHTAPVYWALETGMRQAIRRRAEQVAAPALDNAQLVRRGLILYRDSCVQCHGAPGVAPAAFSHGLLPLPNNLAQTALEWSAAEVYWVTRNGLKMTGMPAWQFRYPDQDLWAIVAFVMWMPRLTAAQYAALGHPLEEQSAHQWRDLELQADARRGEIALQQYACTGCHRIPGIVGADAHVGPSLEGFARRKYLAGRLTNTQDNLIAWIRRPKEIKPQTLMPDLGVTQAHALDMAAFLYTLN